VKRDGRVWGGIAALVGAAVVLLVGSGATGGTFALFNAETQNASSTFAGGWIGAATGATATASGYDMSLAWTPGTHGPVTGQQLLGVDNGTNSNCTGAAYASIATPAVSAGTYSDASRANATNNGHWFCYEIVSTSATVWTATSTFSAQLGLVANGISASNAATRCSGAATPASGKLDCTDKLVLTFNQKPLLPSSPIKVCAWSANGTIIVGDTATSCSSRFDTASVGTISGLTIAANAAYTSSTYTLSTSAPWTMTITLAGATTTSTISGTMTFTPASTIKSAVTTHQASICTAASSTCRPTASSSF
jgi:hypothetical protein